MLKKYLPIFECELIDTTSLSNDDIQSIFNTASLKFSMVVFKYIQTSPERVFEELHKLKQIINSLLDNQEGEEVIKTTTIYFSKIPNTDMETIINNFTKIKKSVGLIAKSAWEKEQEKWEEIGEKKFEKGIEKGIEREKEENAIKMLKRNFEIILIQDITGLSIERINELQSELEK